MKKGDLIRVWYPDGNTDLNDPKWTEPFHGIIFETPNMGKNCVWKMWCIERETTHIISPRKDRIEVISEANIGD